MIKKGNFEFIDCPESNHEEFDTGSFIGETKAMFD